MNLLFRFLKPKSLVTAGAAGIILMALWLGPQFGIPRKYLFFGIIAIVLIWTMVMIIMRIRASRASKALEKSIEEQAQAQIDGSRPGREKDIEELKEGLQQAIEALKRSRVGKSSGTGTALYILPWYMIIGPPAVGKTTLLKKSGLNFPYADPKRNDPSVKGVGGTRNCDWWFAEEAVILDTAGRYILPVEEDDSQEWLEFLDLLRRHRGRKPLNGLLVAVSIEDLVKGGVESAEEHAKKIRTRIDELINRLGISFPVYLVFTKCDLIRGFVEYFGDINRDHRASVWGATISRDRSGVETAENIFRNEMLQLEQQLLNARIPRQAAGTRRETRDDLHFFPLQFQALRDRLAIFVEHLFRVNPYQESPVFRGFYFTSGTQEGRPIDQVIHAMLSGFGLTSEMEGKAVEQTETKSYFIQRVFSKIIFPDRNMAGPSAAGERRRRARRVKVFATGAVVTALLAASLFVLSATNSSLIRDVQGLSNKIAVMGEGRSPELTLSNLKDMDALREKLQKMDMRGRPLAKVLFLGTYQGEPAAEAARELYLRFLLGGIMRPASSMLARRLDRNADSLIVSFGTYYQWYKTWSIIQDPGTRFSRPAVKDMTPTLSEHWMSVTSGLDSERNQQEYVKLLEKQLDYGSDFPHLLVPYFEPGRSESQDMKAKSAIRRYWSAEGMYPSMLAASSVPDIAVSDQVSLDLGVAGSYLVPGVFSTAGWEGPVSDYFDRLEEVRIGWVMEDTYNDTPASIRNVLLARYALSYTDSWLEFLKGVELDGVTDVETTRTFLERASKDNSPLLRVLREVERNTRFDKEDDPSLIDVAEKYGVINEFFRNPTSSNPLRFLKGGGESDKAPYFEYIERVEALAQAYASIATESGNLRGSEEYLGFLSWIDTRIPQAPEDLVAAEMVRILRLPLDAATRTVRRAAQSDLQVKWNPVYQEYRETLDDHYPLELSNADASLKDFEKFFGDGGTFWTFYEENLSSLVSEDGQVLTQGVSLTSKFLSALKKANHIRHALFSNGGSTAGFDFSIRTSVPVRDAASGIIMKSTHLDVGGTSFGYTMGAPFWKSIRWPGDNAEAGAVLRLDAGTTASFEAMEYDGAWGFFRLLDRTEEIVGGDSAGEVSLIWRFPAGEWDVTVTYEVLGLPSRHPLKENFLRINFPRTITAN